METSINKLRISIKRNYKKNQIEILELKSTIIETNSLEELNSVFKQSEESVSLKIGHLKSSSQVDQHTIHYGNFRRIRKKKVERISEEIMTKS